MPEIKENWIHKTLALEIGGQKFFFRTLSLYDVWKVWPHMEPVVKAMGLGSDGPVDEPLYPLAYERHVGAILEILCPMLKSSEAAMTQFKGVHFNAVKEFYENEHDWELIREMGGSVTEAEPPPEEPGPDASGLTQEDRFFLVCLAGADFCKTDVKTFIENRVEFCARAFIVMRKVQAESESGKVLDQEGFIRGMKVMLEEKTFDAQNLPWMADWAKRDVHEN